MVQIFSMKCSIQRGEAELNGTFHLFHSTRDYADACVMLNARTAPVAFAPRRVSHVVFLISLVLKQTSEDCIGNTEHSNINVNDECNSK